MQCNRCGAELYSTGSGLSGLCPTCDSFAKISVGGKYFRLPTSSDDVEREKYPTTPEHIGDGTPKVTITIDGKPVAEWVEKMNSEEEIKRLRAENERLTSDVEKLQQRLANLIDGSEYERLKEMARELAESFIALCEQYVQTEDSGDIEWAWKHLDQDDVKELLKDEKQQ